MQELIIYEHNINEDDKNKLLLFLKENCNKISIENDYTGKLTESEINDIQDELISWFEKDIQNKRKMYKEESLYRDMLFTTIGIKNEEQAEEYFNCIEKENEEVIHNFKVKKARKNLEYCPDVKQGYLGNKITRVSYNSLGGLYNILFYDIAMLETIIGEKKNLFDYVNIGKKQFWNLTFYFNDKVIFSIHTDAKCASCKLDNNMFQEFKKLEITFEES